MLTATLILLPLAVALIVGPPIAWTYLSDDETAQPGWASGAVLIFTPAAILAAYTHPSPPTIAWALAQLVILAWLEWQWIVATFGYGLVYFLRLDTAQRARSGHIVYIGFTGRDWTARKAEHQDDRSGSWADWKADVDWTISGPAFRRITAGAARRHETRMIRTLTHAARLKVVPPIENRADTNLHGPFHPILRARYVSLRAQGVMLPARRVKLKPGVFVESPGPAGLSAAPPVSEMGLVVDVDGAEVAAANAPETSAATAGPPPDTGRHAEPHADAPDPTTGSSESESSERTDLVPPDPADASHPTPSHPTTHHPPVGGMPDGTETWDESDGEDGTSGPDDPEDEGGGEPVSDTGLGDEVEAWLNRGPAELPAGDAEAPTGGVRGSSGGKGARPVKTPEWVALARFLRDGDDELSLDDIRATLAGAGHTVSRSTLHRWLKRNEERS